MRLMCKSKIHRARIKKVEVHYEGSIGIDKVLLKASDILPYEIVQVVNVNTGVRFETYAIEERAGSGIIALYGGAAQLGKLGEIIIIISYNIISDEASKKLRPKIILVDSNNKIIKRNP